jgi:hypothetical protein
MVGSEPALKRPGRSPSFSGRPLFALLQRRSFRADASRTPMVGTHRDRRGKKGNPRFVTRVATGRGS